MNDLDNFATLIEQLAECRKFETNYVKTNIDQRSSTHALLAADTVEFQSYKIF